MHNFEADNADSVDGLGRLVYADENISNASENVVDFSYSFDYDMRSQIKQADIDKDNNPFWNAQYSYRKDGNLESRTINSSTTSFTYDGDLMESASGDNTELWWNWDGKLRSATKGTKNISIKYDPMGNRVLKDSNEAGEHKYRKYIVDISGDLPTILLELDATDYTVRKIYMYANSQIIAQHDGNDTDPRYFYLHDRLGSVRQIIDSSGNVKNCYTYQPFGELFDTETTENISNPFKFTGQYYDTEIAQYYLRARQYDPALMRFTSRDPVRGDFKEPLTLHQYLYCLNDPINKQDPSGLFWSELWEWLKNMVGVVGDQGGSAQGGQALLESGASALSYQTAIDAVCDDWGFIATPEYAKLRGIAMREKVEKEKEEEEDY